MGGVVRAGLVALIALCLLASGCRATVGPQQGDGAASRPGQTGTVILVAIGASDAVGVGATNPDTDNWVARLGTKLPS
ncbi:MAG TPA: hypothetical protein VH916_07005, partial [Dehalococcoidia bacterium]